MLYASSNTPFRWVFGAVFSAVFGAEFGAKFGGFPNPPPLSISISRCDNYCCFPYHLKRITNSYTHSSVDFKSTEHPLQREEERSSVKLFHMVSFLPEPIVFQLFVIGSSKVKTVKHPFTSAFVFGQRPLVPPNIRSNGETVC